MNQHWNIVAEIKGGYPTYLFILFFNEKISFILYLYYTIWIGHERFKLQSRVSSKEKTKTLL